MQFHNIKPNTRNKSRKIIGRGGKRGKTSGRGGKGQTARAGNKRRPEIRDIIKRIPKLRGHSRNRALSINLRLPKPKVVSVGVISKSFAQGAVVTPRTLVAAGVVGLLSGHVPAVKVLGDGEVDKKLTLRGCSVSAQARAKIEKAGGKIVSSK